MSDQPKPSKQDVAKPTTGRKGKAYGYDCAICGEPLFDNEVVAHTDNGLTHDNCCDQPKPTTGEWTDEDVRRCSCIIGDNINPKCHIHNTLTNTEWTEGRVFAYFESEDFKGLADAINSALAPDRENVAAAQQPLVDALEWAWTIIANAGGGDWTKESKEWQDAAARWRNDYHDQPKPTTGEPKCNLCETGFPLNKHGNHIPTRSLGMIPVTRCKKLPKPRGEWTVDGDFVCLGDGNSCLCANTHQAQAIADAHKAALDAAIEDARKAQWRAWAELLRDGKPRALCAECGYPELIGSDDCRNCGVNFHAGRFELAAAQQPLVDCLKWLRDELRGDEYYVEKIDFVLAKVKEGK